MMNGKRKKAKSENLVEKSVSPSCTYTKFQDLIEQQDQGWTREYSIVHY